jgi:hypothetical protein
MGNSKERKGLPGQRTLRPLLAMTLAASLAAFGCTTNQNLGNGTPTRSGPEVKTAPTSGVTSGGETATPVTPPPMTSSYTRAEALPTVTARAAATTRPVARGTERVIRRSPDEAAAIMAGRQQLAGRYLGVVSPALSNQQYVSANLRTGEFQNPALVTNPQLTINSSISSPPLPAIGPGVDTALTTTTGTTAAATVAGTASTGTSATTVGTLPTVASSGIPPVTAASVGTGRATAVAGTTTTTGTTASVTVTAPATAIGSATGNIRVMRSTSGAVTVTNATSSATATPTTATPTTASGRNQ